MKIIVLIGILLSMQGCMLKKSKPAEESDTNPVASQQVNAVEPKFSGRSATFGGDHILLNDLVNSIKKYQSSTSGCASIDTVKSEIIDTKKINGFVVIDEVWDVTACGVKKTYTINLKADQNGKINYRIGLK